jgi:hypothetical protein
VCRPKHVEQLRNIVIINSTTRLHVVGSFYEKYPAFRFCGNYDELAASIKTWYDLFTGAWNTLSDMLTIKIFLDLIGTKQEMFAEK